MPRLQQSARHKASPKNWGGMVDYHIKFNVYSMSTCTICDCCAQCALGEDEQEDGRLDAKEGRIGFRKHPPPLHHQQPPPPGPPGVIYYNLSSTTASWNYLNRPKDEEDEDEDEEDRSEDVSLSCDSVIENFVSESVARRAPVMNLQRQLKEAFGAR